MEQHELLALVEAMLFAADRPLTPNAMAKAMRSENVDAKVVRESLKELAEKYDHVGSGIRLAKLGSGFQVLTREDHAEVLERLLKSRRRMRLSRAALETAAVIAYKQPISRTEIERVRGVDAGGVVNTLLERDLIMIKGRDPGPGRALLYGTTQGFLEYFGLSSVNDLPRLDELAELAGIDRSSWTDAEQARFEKHGIDVENMPGPDHVTADDPEEPDVSQEQPASQDQPAGELPTGS